MKKNGYLGYRMIPEPLLKGMHGCEVGGLNNPVAYTNTKMDYVDVISLDDARANFPEVIDELHVDVSYLGDVSKRKISEITGKQYDFVVANNVIEHVQNPIRFLDNLLSGIKNDGYLIISAPDKDCCFDKDRELTEFEHLLADWYLECDEVDATHYIDALIHIRPESLHSKDSFIKMYNAFRKRFEHVHVWNKMTFKYFLQKSFDLLSVEEALNVDVIFEDCYHAIENLTVLKVNRTRKNRIEQDREMLSIILLKHYYSNNLELQEAFPNAKELLSWAIIAHSVGDVRGSVLTQYSDIYTDFLNDLGKFQDIWNIMAAD